MMARPSNPANMLTGSTFTAATCYPSSATAVARHLLTNPPFANTNAIFAAVRSKTKCHLKALTRIRNGS